MPLKLFLGIIFILIVFWMYRCTLQDTIKKLKKDKELAEYWQDQWHKRYSYFYLLYKDLDKRNRILLEENSKLKMNNFHTFAIDKDVEAAIRFAMINSHPDKGGKEEDFIRFHTLYKKIKNK